MIIDANDTKAMGLLEQLKFAHESQAVAVRALHEFLERGNDDMKTMEKLTKDMGDGTNRIADIQNELQGFRLDR